ncbi:MAG: glycosyltransferase [Clostridia bacterium]|nr:glycosyltransferase [Clostridia bacterium]
MEERIRYMDEKISIIIPVYNAEKYVKRCLESIVNQTYTNLEIICINDGSKDNSLQIINEYKKKDNRIIVIDKVNQGVSEARNDGIKLSSGEYIVFVDADDFIELSMISALYDIMKKNNVDVVKTSYNIVLDNNKCIRYIYDDEFANKILLRNDAINVFKQFFFDGITIWGTLYRKSLIDSIDKFDKNFVYGEDVIFFLNVLLNVKNIYFLNGHLYNYVYNKDGACFNVKNYEINKQNFIKFSKIVINKLIENDFMSNDERKTINARYLGSFLSCFLYSFYTNSNSLKKFKMETESIKKDSYINELLNNCSLKNISWKFKVVILCVKYNLYSVLYFLFKIRNVLKVNN